MDKFGANPAISVLIPTRDAVGTIAACVRSMRRQSLDNFECVLVDDGSQDGTGERYRAAADGDPRFRLLTNGADGIVAALNRGLDHCRGHYVARMDSDDVMHRDRLRLQLALAEQHDPATLLGCHVRLFPRDANLGRGIRDYESWLNSLGTTHELQRDRYVECPLAHPTWFIPRERICKLRYRDVDWPEDYDLLLRHLQDGGRLATVPRRLLVWRHGPQRLSQVSARYGPAAFTRCKAHYLRAGFLRESVGFQLWGYGATGRQLCRALKHLDRRPSLIIEMHAGRIGQSIADAPVLAPEQVDPARLDRLLVSVAGVKPRQRIRDWLEARGLQEGRQFICVA